MKASGVKARAMLAALVLCSWSGIASAQDSQTPPRRIAPDQVPEYRTGAARDDAATGRCDAERQISVRLRCLREAKDESDRLLASAITAVEAALEARPGAAGGQKRYWLRTLRETQEKWVELRNIDCRQLAPAELGADENTYVAQTLCLIRTNRSRAAELKQRFGGE